VNIRGAEIEFCTACVPFCAAASDWRATLADCEALSDIRVHGPCHAGEPKHWSGESRQTVSGGGEQLRGGVLRGRPWRSSTCAAAALIRPTRVLSSSMGSHRVGNGAGDFFRVTRRFHR